VQFGVDASTEVTVSWHTLATVAHPRAAFTFTSFGDQGTPTTGRRFVPPPGVTLRIRRG
jgi:hypothetical protein